MKDKYIPKKEMVLSLQQRVLCSEEIAEKILQFTGGDFDGAVQILTSVEKDIYIFRGKFYAQIKELYGNFFVAYNSKTKEILDHQFFVVSKDKSAIEFDFNVNWKEYLLQMNDYKMIHPTLLEPADFFYNHIISAKTINVFSSKLNQNNLTKSESAIQNFFSDLLMNVTGDVSIVLKIDMVLVDIFEYNFKNKEDSTEDPESRLSSETNEELFTLLVSPEISPINGIAISQLNIKDRVAVRVIDTREVIDSIMNQLMQDGEIFKKDDFVYLPLSKIEMEGMGFLLTFDIGPGVQGQAFCAGDFKVACLGDVSKNVEEIDDEDRMDSIFYKYLWIIVTLLGTMLVVLISFLLFF